MEALIPIFIFFAVFGTMFLSVVLSVLRQRRTTQLFTSGVPARGLILQISRTGFDVVLNGYRYEKRSVVVDVEIPGQAPYQISAQPLIPKNLIKNVLPGTFVELRVDPTKSDNLAVVGPGGIYFVPE